MTCARIPACTFSSASLAGDQGRFVVIIAALVLSILPVLAQPLPVPKPSGQGGSCPHGYTSSGSFCVPGAGVQDAIAKPPNGTCPWHWIASGSYCLRSSNVRR
jgi:hypothetical protein